MLSLGAFANVTNGSDVGFLKTAFVVHHSDACLVHDELHTGTRARCSDLFGVVIVVRVLNQFENKVSVLAVQILRREIIWLLTI